MGVVGRVFDPFWVDPQGQVVTVYMNPLHALAYQNWLRQEGLFMFAIPDAHPVVYSVGVRHMEGDERYD